MCPVNVSRPALFIFTWNKGKNRVPQVVGVSRRENENQFQLLWHLKWVFILSFSLTCCVWPFLICSYTSRALWSSFSNLSCWFSWKSITQEMHFSLHAKASLVFSKPSKINQTRVSQIPSKFPDFEVNTKCTNLPVRSHGSTSNPYQKSG